MAVVSGELAVLHGLYAATGFILLYFSYKYARKYYNQAAFLLPPFVCFCVIYENIVLASVGLDKEYDSVKVMLAFQSCIIPAMLLICFEVAYLVHKNRSVNFCGISFDSGHRTHRDEFKSTFLRFAMWLVGLGLLTLKLLVYYRYYDDIVFTSGIYEVNGSATVGTILTIIPAFSLVVLSIYIGMRLWNYGSNYAYTVHSTCFNPWIWMMVGSFLLAAGYLMPDPLFARSSKGGEICMLAAIIRMFREVHKDLQEGTEIANTLLDGSAAGLHDHAGSPRNNFQESPSTSGASSKYDLIGSPVQRRTVEETRLTDASTEAYLSVVIARTKETTAAVAPRKQAQHDEFVEVSLGGPPRPKLAVPMLQEQSQRSASASSMVLPWPADAAKSDADRKSSSIFDELPLMDFPPPFFASMEETLDEVTVFDAGAPLDLVAATDSVPPSMENAQDHSLAMSFELIAPSLPAEAAPSEELLAPDQVEAKETAILVPVVEQAHFVATVEAGHDVEFGDLVDAAEELHEARPVEAVGLTQEEQVTESNGPAVELAPVERASDEAAPVEDVVGPAQAVKDVEDEVSLEPVVDEVSPSNEGAEGAVDVHEGVAPAHDSLHHVPATAITIPDSPLIDAWEHVHADDELLRPALETTGAASDLPIVQDVDAGRGAVPDLGSFPDLLPAFNEVPVNGLLEPFSSSPVEVKITPDLVETTLDQDQSCPPSPLQDNRVPDHLSEDAEDAFPLDADTSPPSPHDHEHDAPTLPTYSEEAETAAVDPLDLMFSMVGIQDDHGASPPASPETP